MLEQSSNNDANPNCYSGKAPAPPKKKKTENKDNNKLLKRL